MNRLTTILLFLCINLLLSGCETLKPAPIGHFKTEGVVISSVDNTFTLKSGDTFAIPFTTECGIGAFGYQPSQLSLGYKNALGIGAKKVSVKVENRGSYFGLMTFCGLSEDNYGPATRSYEIEIPSNYLDSASDGRISVVYETVAHKNPKYSPWYAWVLWISDRDF